MKKIMFFVILAASIFIAHAAVAQQVIAAPPKASASSSAAGDVNVAGQVVDLATNKPVPKISFYLIQRSERNASAKTVSTDEKGKFQLKVPAGSELQIIWGIASVNSNSQNMENKLDPFWLGGENQVFSAGKIERDKTDMVLKVKLWRGKPLSGKVLGPDGKPFKGATIYLHPQIPPATSDERGQFTINVPEDQDFDLLATDMKAANRPNNSSLVAVLLSGPPAPPKPPTLAGMVHLPGGAAEATIQLEPTVSIKGQAVTPDGQPANNLNFTAQPFVSRSAIMGMAISCKTADDGSFTMDHALPKGSYAISWSGAQGNRDYDYGNEILDLGKLKPGAPVKITAKKFLNALMGKVVDAQGRPIPGAQLRIVSFELVPSDLRSRVCTSDKNGNFEIPRLAAGKVKVQATYEQYSEQVETASDSVDCVIKLGKP